MAQAATLPLNNRSSYVLPMIFIGSLFFIFGFITWANSQLIPYLKIACELSPSESLLVATAFFAAYFFMALPASAILRHTGYKRGISLGLGIMAIGALLFIPAANARSYPLFLMGLFIIGTGLALLQTASNPYVAVLGPHESAAQRIAIMGICNKIAGILAVYVLGAIALKDADAFTSSLQTMDAAQRAVALDGLASRVVTPYLIIAAALGAMAILFLFLSLPEIREEDAAEDSALSRSRTSVLQFPHLLLGAGAIFFYVGAEVISYDTFAGFGQQLGFPLDDPQGPWYRSAKNFASFTGYALLAGYLVGIAAVPRLIKQEKALVISCVLSIILVVIACNTSGWIAVGSFAFLGFSNAMMWPAIFPMALKDLGRFTKVGAAILIMMIVGGAVLPPLYGKLLEGLGDAQRAYYLLIPCYLYILYFAVAGHKAGRQAS
jgi:glucose/galactose transporter